MKKRRDKKAGVALGGSDARNSNAATLSEFGAQNSTQRGARLTKKATTVRTDFADSIRNWEEFGKRCATKGAAR
jgi:hypothetical protein